MSLVYSFKEGFKDKSQLGNKGGNLVTMVTMVMCLIGSAMVMLMGMLLLLVAAVGR